MNDLPAVNNHHAFSPSALNRIRLCPGSARLIAAMDPSEVNEADEDSAYSEEGTMLHGIMAGNGDTDALTFEQKNAIDWCKIQIEELFDLSEVEHYFEHHMTLLSKSYEVLTEGTADLVIFDRDSATVHVYDWKFGRGDVEPALGNLQIMVYVAMAMDEFSCSRGVGHIVQPRLYEHSTCNVLDNLQVVDIVRAVRERAASTNSPVVPGLTQCKYCPAILRCPAARAICDYCMMARVDGEIVPAELEPDQVAELYTATRVAMKIGERVAAKLRRVCEDNGTCGVYSLKEVRGPRSFTSTSGAFSALNGVISSEAFLELTKASVSALQTAYIEARLAQKEAAGQPIKRGDKTAFRNEFDQLTAHVVERGPNSTQIKKGK